MAAYIFMHSDDEPWPFDVTYKIRSVITGVHSLSPFLLPNWHVVSFHLRKIVRFGFVGAKASWVAELLSSLVSSHRTGIFQCHQRDIGMDGDYFIQHSLDRKSLTTQLS